MECPAVTLEQQCLPVWGGACAAVVCVLLSALLCIHWFKLNFERSAPKREQTKDEQAIGQGEVAASATAPVAVAPAAAPLLPLLRHNEKLCVEVSSLLGRGRRGFIFKGKWHGAPVAVKVVRLPLRVRQHSDGAQPKSVSPISHYVAHPNLVELYTYKWTVVTRERNFVSGSLRSPGSSIPVNLRQALQLAGATTAACARDERHGELLEVVTVAELCQEGTLRDHIDIMYNMGSCPISGAPSCEGQGLPSRAPSECAFPVMDQASLDGDCGGADDEVALMPEEAASMVHGGVPPTAARLQVVEQSAERSLARADCSIPENFIHFTGSSKPSELHDSDGELALNLTTLLEVGRGLTFLHASGIVHGNLSSSTVLLRNSTLDRRGFIAKIGHGGDGRVPVPAGKSAGEFHEPTQADDVYAFGALMVEMVTGKCPDRSSDGQAAILEFVRRSLPSAYKLLVRQCLALEAVFRPSMAEVVYSLGVLEEQMRETCALSEVDILFSMFNDQGPATPPACKGPPRRRPRQSPTSSPGSPPASAAVRADLASIDALFGRCLEQRPRVHSKGDPFHVQQTRWSSGL